MLNLKSLISTALFVLVVLINAFSNNVAFANNKLNIFACEPEWALLANEIVKDKANIISATYANQNPHFIQAKPSLISAVNKADLLICTGADLEVGWLPLLISKSGNINATIIYTAQYVDLIDKPTEEELDRSHGDVHSMGNPHLHLNPYNMIKVAKAILNILKRIDPENKDFYLQNYDDFVKIFTSQIKNLEDKAKNLQNKNFISHHKDFDYLAQWLNFKIPYYLEEKPGITPSASYLNKLLKNIATTKIDGIIRSPYSPPQASLFFASKTNIKEFVVPYTKDFDSKNNLIQLYTDIIDTLINNVG